MFTRLLRPSQSHVHASFPQDAAEGEAFRNVDRELENRLFGAARKAQSLTSLSVHAHEGAALNGETGRNDALGNALEDLSAQIANLLQPQDNTQTQAVEPVSDNVVSDFLFDSAVKTEAVEADLFDVSPGVSEAALQNQIIAASQTGRLKGLGADRSSTETVSGRVSPMLNGACS